MLDACKIAGAGTTVVITGDIAEAPSLIPFMSKWRTALEANKFNLKFICGNHDYYNGNIKNKRLDLSNDMAGAWLPTCGVVSLTQTTALVGHDGWYDGLYSNWFESRLDMNDYYLIDELNSMLKTKVQRFEKLQELSQESADYVYMEGSSALKTHKTLFIATHVPPFMEAAYFKGKMSDSDWLPHFSSKRMGDAILNLAKENPKSEITVLCGHTHVGVEGSHICNPAKNVVCYTGCAEYGAPRIGEIFTIE